jgi:hypothetical protein
VRSLYLVLALVATVCSSAQVLGQSVAEILLRSTVLLQHPVPPDKVSSGTGFFIFRAIQGDQGHIFLVTNKHVLPNAGGPTSSMTIRVTSGPADKPVVEEVEVPVVGADGRYLPNVKLYQGDADVAAINVTATIIQSKVSATWIPFDLLATREQLKAEGITVGDEVFLLGFPGSMFDKRNPSPILRTGVIATAPLEGYAFNDRLRAMFSDLPERLDGFLIDANVFPGSSGSVVVLKPVSAEVGIGGSTMVSNRKKRPYVLGVLADSIPINDTALHAVQRMGVGVVYSSETIRTVIESFYR